MSETETTGKRPRGRPATGKTPVRTTRIGPIWDEAAAIAAERGETMTAVVERGLQRYVTRHRRGQAEEIPPGRTMR